MMKRLLIATTNPGKILEYKEIFKELKLSVDLISLKEAGIAEKVEEDGKTFEENAVKKARFYFNLSKLPTMSDDAGLEIDYLNGEPGVVSRRWPGHEASDEELIQIALEKLKGVPKEKRGAQLRAAISLILPSDDKVYTFEGILRGSIAEKPFDKIIAGYPFRSIFITENQLFFHRKKAVEKALPIIKKYLC